MIISVENLNVRVRVRIIATLFMGKILSQKYDFSLHFSQLIEAKFSKIFNYSVRGSFINAEYTI